MKSVMIFYAQSLTVEVLSVINSLSIRGYSKWEHVTGRGTTDGEPHLGSHAWPSLNSSIMVVVEDEKVAPLFKKLRELDNKTSMQGLKAFSWNIEETL